MIFWYIVQSEQVLEISRKVRVQLIAPEGFVVKGSNILYKDATLRGPRSLLSHFPSEPINSQIRIFTDRPQNIRTRVDREHIRAWNDRIKITIYDPYLSVYIDKKSDKEIQIKQNFLGSPKDGYAIEQVLFEPEKVTISGAASDIQRIESISTEPIDINGLASTKTFDTPFLLADLSLKVLPKKVRVTVKVGEKKVSRLFSNIPIQIEGGNAYFKIKPSQISVNIQGSPSRISAMQETEIRAFLDIKDLSPGTYIKKVQLTVPNDVPLIGTQPETISIEIHGRKKSLWH